MPAPNVIQLEMQDLNGLISDLYRRVARQSPGQAGEVAEVLKTCAGYFQELAERDQGSAHDLPKAA